MPETAPAATEAGGEDSHRTKGLLRLTMACNERCPFCNVPAEDYETLTPPLSTSEAEVDAFIESGARTMTVSGGEPTLLKKRLLILARRAKDGGIPFIELQTNAVLITPGYAAGLADAGVTSAFVSFLSHVPEHHDALTSLKGSYPKCLAGIDALLAAGIRVTLNPVTARLTQHLVPDFIDFVAQRLPGVRFVSMSAVQPHGRARVDPELLPDYAVLSGAIREARRRAEVHGIELVNPYCGLPLCVGWDDALDRSVEAFEAASGGWRDTRGLDNVGNKSHGAPCQKCALRTRCGGAWHAYWTVRGGSGIAAPVSVREPWADGDDHAQQVVVGPGLSPETVAAIDASDRPTTWLWTDRLSTDEVGPLVKSRCTDVALDLDSLDPDLLRPALSAARRLVRVGAAFQPQSRIRVHVGFRPGQATNPRALLHAISLAAAVGVDAVRVLSPDPRWARLLDHVREQHPRLDVAAGLARPFPRMDTP